MGTHPTIKAWLQTNTRNYELQRFNIHMERQRPTLIQMTIDEPIPITDDVGVVKLGYLDDPLNTFIHSSVKILSFSEASPQTFDVVAIEPLRQYLDASFKLQFLQTNLLSVFDLLAKNLKLVFQVVGTPPPDYPKNFLFLGTVRNALDQIWQIYDFKLPRWRIDPVKARMYYYGTGALVTAPQQLQMQYFKAEFDGGVEMNIIPAFRPYLPVLWRQQQEVVDIVRINSQKQSMYVTFAEKPKLI